MVQVKFRLSFDLSVYKYQWGAKSVGVRLVNIPGLSHVAATTSPIISWTSVMNAKHITVGRLKHVRAYIL
jgi:hypothetical protein